MENLYSQIEAFQKKINQVVELLEEVNTQSGEIPDVSLGEAANKMKLISDLCADGIKELQNAVNQAEDMQKTIGG